MAFKTGGGDELNAEINVTPFVDVMLVLLIIFMITAPMMANTGVELQLPQVKAQPIDDPTGKLAMSIMAFKPPKCMNKYCAFLGTTQILWKELEVKIKANERVQREGALYIDAEPDLPYGVILEAMARAKDAGVEKVMMITDPNNAMPSGEFDKPGSK